MVSTHSGKATRFQKGKGRKEQAWYQDQDAGSSVVSYAFAATYVKKSPKCKVFARKSNQILQHEIIQLLQ
jgi:hypothetical protein